MMHRTAPPVRTALLALAAGALLVSLTGCTRTVRTTVKDGAQLKVVLRHTVQNMASVERGYEHPRTVSSQRLMHIIGAIDVEVTEGAKRERHRAVHPELLQPIAQALVDAFEQADSTQQVAVQAVRKQHRLGIFHKKFLTSFTAFFREDRLHIHFSRIEWEIPKDRENRLPEPDPNEKQMAFRTIGARNIASAGSQGVAVRWRANLFANPVRSNSEAGGDMGRRTLLMESPVPAEELEDGVDPVELEADALRAIADLKEQRRAGAITESEYQRRLEELLGSRP